MTGHRRFNDLVGRRVRLRSKLIRWKWKLQHKFGRCRHEAQTGPAGGNEGWCAICGAVVPWDDE